MYVIFRDPSTSYEKVIERYCLRYRSKNSIFTKEKAHKAAQAYWKENKLSSNEELVLEFLKLKNGEKPFVR